MVLHLLWAGANDCLQVDVQWNYMWVAIDTNYLADSTWARVRLSQRISGSRTVRFICKMRGSTTV
jgi:hypothetical protein